MTKTVERPRITTFWSSLRRALGSVLTVFSLPLLFLAAISAAKLMSALGLIDPAGWLKQIIGWQSQFVARAHDWLAMLHLSVPAYLFDIGFFYIFVGNAVARAETDEILAVELDPGTLLGTMMRGMREFRAEYFFYGFPKFLRGIFVRLLWPVVAVYRFGTPWVVEGPGPGGDEISTSVRRRQMGSFARSVAKAGQWEKQTVYDHRLVLLFQLGLGIASSLVLNALAKLV